VPGTPDIIFRRQKLAIFVHGCFWHACPKHGHKPKSNSAFWQGKFQRNRERDARKLRELADAGWRTLVVWEHDVRDDLPRTLRAVARALRVG
jgi:DNA mismatch endonuclease (patch repair protein)